jgi:hypothetical protein
MDSLNVSALTASINTTIAISSPIVTYETSLLTESGFSILTESGFSILMEVATIIRAYSSNASNSVSSQNRTVSNG